MNEIDAQPLLLFPSEKEFAAKVQYRNYAFLFVAGAVSLASACAFVYFPLILAPILVALFFLLSVLIWNYPRLMFYIVFAAVCLCELNSGFHSDALLERIPFFANVNTIVQVYGHADFKAIPFNLMEVFLVVAGAVSFFRGVVAKELSLRVGPLFFPIFGYFCFVVIGWINGMMTDGDFKISLMEVRPQSYLLLAYLMAVNVLRDRRDIDRIFWLAAVCIGIKGVLYTFRRYVTMAGVPLPDQGVGSHDEAFLFAAYIVLAGIVTLVGFKKNLIVFMWCLMPFVILGDLATNRRAGMGALLLAIPLLLLTVERAVPKYRTRIRILGAVAGISFALYYPAYKNSTSTLAQPAHAVSSMFDPNPRDASSNAYRDAENADLVATIRLSPILGYGYGKRMLHAVPIADISANYQYWDIMTHNSIFWVWMRVGSIGFFAFWIMVANMVIYGAQTLRAKNGDVYHRAMGAYLVLLVTMLMVFGLFDLGLINFRGMLFVGMWAGALVAVVKSAPLPAPGNETSQ